MLIEELNNLAVEIAGLKDLKKQLDKESAECEAKLEPLQEKFNELLVQEGKPNWYVEGYGLFSPKISNWYKVLDYPKLRDHLRATGLDDMLTVNANALRGWLNAMEDRKKFDGIVEQTPKLSISFKRS